jgi:hypothetical protein
MKKVFSLLLLFAFVSCKQVEYVHTHTSDTIFVGSVKIDTFRLLDSVYYHIYTQGDTIYSEKTKVVYRDRYKYERDTIYLHRTDTIKVPIPIEHKATIWERIEYRVDDVVSIIGVIIVGGFILLFIQLLRRQK